MLIVVNKESRKCALGVFMLVERDGMHYTPPSNSLPLLMCSTRCVSRIVIISIGARVIQSGPDSRSDYYTSTQCTDNYENWGFMKDTALITVDH